MSMRIHQFFYRTMLIIKLLITFYYLNYIICKFIYNILFMKFSISIHYFVTYKLLQIVGSAQTMKKQIREMVVPNTGTAFKEKIQNYTDQCLRVLSTHIQIIYGKLLILYLDIKEI